MRKMHIFVHGVIMVRQYRVYKIMIIAIIDSGINKNVFEKHIINQYSVQAGVITEERARDTTGHGTSMLGIF